MQAVYFGSVGDLKRKRDNDNFVPYLKDIYRIVFGELDASLVKSWASSTGYMLDVVYDPKFDNIPVIIKLMITIGAKRIDMTRLGGFNVSF